MQSKNITVRRRHPMLLRRIPIGTDQFGLDRCSWSNAIETAYRGEVVLGLRARRLASWKAEALLHASAIADAFRPFVNLVRNCV